MDSLNRFLISLAGAPGAHFLYRCWQQWSKEVTIMSVCAFSGIGSTNIAQNFLSFVYYTGKKAGEWPVSGFE
jgi:hypothetical protein